MSQHFASGAQSWSFSFHISPSNEHSGLISFRMDWLDLLAVQGTLKFKSINSLALSFLEDNFVILFILSLERKSHPKEVFPIHYIYCLLCIYLGHLMWRADSFEKTLMLGKIEGRRRRGWQRMRWLEGITSSKDMNLSKSQELVMDRESWHSAVYGVTENWTQLSNWTELKQILEFAIFGKGDLMGWTIWKYKK